jgi:deoxyribose-phosphate aldolase
MSSLTRPDTADLAGLIDHTVLKADATSEEIIRACKEAVENGFATVCVNSRFIPLVAQKLAQTPVKPIAVVGFPLGAASTASKVFETREAIREGAREIDMVIAIGALKEKDYAYVSRDIAEVVQASEGHPVKVILETALLTDDEKIKACTLAKDAGASFVKTSTGFGPGGATAADIALMRKTVGPKMGVKASGGIRTREDALKMIEAGASRIGASSSVAIVKNVNKTEKPGLY